MTTAFLRLALIVACSAYILGLALLFLWLGWIVGLCVTVAGLGVALVVGPWEEGATGEVELPVRGQRIAGRRRRFVSEEEAA